MYNYTQYNGTDDGTVHRGVVDLTRDFLDVSSY